MASESCYSFDVDGVVVDVRLRLEEARRAEALGARFEEVFFDEELIRRLDMPRHVGVELVRSRARDGRVIVVSARPARLRRVTIEQFVRFTGVEPLAVLLRPPGDFRPAGVVKAEHLEAATKKLCWVMEHHDDDEEVLRYLSSRLPWLRLYLHYDDTYTRFR